MPEFDRSFQQAVEQLAAHCAARQAPGWTWFEPGEPDDRFSPDVNKKIDLSSLESLYSQSRADETRHGDLSALLVQYSTAAAIRRDWLARRRTRLGAVAHGTVRLGIAGTKEGVLLCDTMEVVKGYQEAAHGV